MNLDEIILFPALFALIGWVLWLWMKRFQALQQERMKQLEIQLELARKFSASNEFIEFVQSEQGKQVFSQTEMKPQLKVLRFLTASVILILVGAGMLINGYSYHNETDLNFVNKARDLYYWGSMAIAIGSGLLINAGITLRLARKWNLFNGRGQTAHG